MSHRTSILCRHNLRAYAAAFIAYLMLAGQMAPLALGAAPRPLPLAAATAPAKAAPQPAAPVVFAAPNIVATKVDAFPSHPSGKAEPGDTITYTVTISNTGDADATSVVFTDNVDGNTTLTGGSVNTQPITDPDTYPASGNIPISLAAAGGVLANDRDPDTGNNTGLTVTKVQGSAANVGVATDTTATGRGSVKGSVTLNSDGSFSYEPPPGFEGADTFTYDASDGTTTDTQTVTINVGGASGMVWFISNSAGGSNRGTFSNPFTSIASFNTANAGTGAIPDPKNGDFIALRTGTGTYNETDGINLRAQQKVIGEGVAFNTSFTAAANSSSAYNTFATTAGSAPTITTSGGNGVDLSTDNTLRGFNVGGISGTFSKINGGAVGSPIINTVSLTGAGAALNISTSGAFGSNVTFSTLESTSASSLSNLNLVSVTGTLGITSGGTGLTNSSTSPAVNVSGGTVAFTYPGNVSRASGTGALVSVSGGHGTGTIAFSATLSASAGTGLQFDNADGTYNFTGTTTLNGGDAGIDILNGSGGTFSFGANTAITNPTNACFVVNSSSPGVTYSGNITRSGTSTGRLVDITGQGAGTITFQTGTLSSTSSNGTGILLSGADGTVNFNGTTTLNGGDSGVDIISGSDGTFTFTSGTTIGSTGSGPAFDVSSSPGTPTVNFAGTITQGGAQRAVNVDGTTGDTVSFTGTVTANGSSTGVLINNANGGNVSFTTLNLGSDPGAGGARLGSSVNGVTILKGTGSGNGTFTLGTVSIWTGSSGTGIAATDIDGTINNTTGILDSSSGSAVNIDGPAGKTTLGMTLTKVNSVGGSANGITIQDTDGSFTVAGTGGSCTSSASCTGGTISNKTGANSNTAGTGVFVNNASSVSLTRMQFNDFSNFAIRGTGASNFTLNNSHFSGVNGDDAGNDDGTIIFDNLSGTSTFSNNDIRGGIEDNFHIINNNTNATNIIISNNTIRDTSTGVSGNDNLFIRALGTSNVTAHITGNTFAATNGDHIQLSAIDSATANWIVTGNFYSGGGGASALLQGITLSGGADGSTETVNFDVSNNGTSGNPLVGNIQGGAININKGNGNGNWQGRVNNNFIGNSAVNSSGSSQSSGIRVEHHGDSGTLTATITNNTVRSWASGPAINTQIGEAGNTTNSGTLNITVTGNTSTDPDPAAQHGFVANIGAAANASDTSVACVDVQNNTMDGNAATSGAGVRTRQRGNSTVKLPGYTGTQYDFAAVATYLQGRNAASTPTATASTSSTGPGYTNTSPAGSACPQPTVPTGPIFSSSLADPGAGASVPADSASSAPAAAPSAGVNNPSGVVKSRPVALPSTGVAPKAPAPKAATPVTAAPKAVRAEAKRSAGTVFRHTAEDSSAPLLAPEPAAQRRKVSAPVLSAPSAAGMGGTVTVTIGTLRAGDSVTITFQVVVEDPYDGGPNVSNQGTVSGGNFSNVLTDDPDIVGTSNPTLTPVNATDVRINDASESEPSTGNTQMLFTVSLSQPAPGGGLTVTYNTANGTATGGASCGGTVDFVSVAGGMATVPAGSQVGTIPITICADSDSPESSETFTVTLTGASAGTIQDATATGTITQGTTAGSFIISELRTSGPVGPGNDFVEFYNNTNSPLTVAASDASAGYGIYKMGATCNDTPVLIGTIPNGTIIPARGHYLAVGSQYSLANYGGTGEAAGNLTFTTDIESDRNVAVFTTANIANISSANRLDAVGFDGNTGAVCDLMREGSNLGATSGSTTEYSFFRKECDFVGGVGCTTPGNPKDTNNNLSDFLFADTDGTFISGIPQKLGAPGPENLASPIRRDTSGIGLPLLDSSVAPSAVPNRVRNFTSDAPNNSTFGTLTIRRRVTNNTGGNVTRLRFRIIEMTTFPAPAGTADLRARTGVTEMSVGPVNDATTCTASGAGAPPCSVTVQATTLETPPAQSNGGGVNSTLSLTLGTPLANGASLNVNFLLGIQQTGTFRFLIIIEALP